MFAGNYRQDIRTKSEFCKDIKLWHRRERDAAKVFERILSTALKSPVHIIENGCDMSGEYLPDHKVTTEPDFRIVFDSGSERFLEIKATKKDLKYFHIKVQQVDQYLKHCPDCIILMVNRWDPSFQNPAFTIFTPGIFREFPFEIVQCHWWGGKLGYRCHVDMFRWEPFVPQPNYPDDFLKRMWIKPDVIRAYKRNNHVFTLSDTRKTRTY